MALAFFAVSYGFSQNKDLDFRFETDTVSVERGLTFINFLVLENKSSQAIHINNLKSIEKYPGLLLSTPSQYKLAAGEKKRFPIKFLVNLDFIKMQSKDITYLLSYSVNGIQKELKTSFFFRSNEKERVSIYPFSREIYINPEAGESTISLFVENRGYQSRSILLTAQSNPNGLEFSPKEMRVSLEGQEKRLIEFKVNFQTNNFFPDYTIRVKAKDLINNENIGSTYLRIKVLSNHKQFSPGPGLETGKNFVEMSYNQQSNNLNYLQMRGNADFSLGKGFEGNFNTLGNYYFEEDKYNFYDTWFDLKKGNSQIRLGNVYGNEYDYNVSGRGGKLRTSIGKNKTIEVLAVENNYSLVGNYFPQHKSSTIAGAKYEFGKTNDFNGKISYVFEHDPRLNIDTQVANAISSFVVDSLHNFQVEAGFSHEKGLIIKDDHTGASAGLNYETRLDKWDFQSLNSWTSKSYAGLSRGSFDLNQKIGYRFSNKTRVFGQYQNAQVNPNYLDFQHDEYIGNPSHAQYFYSTQNAQTGVRFSTSKGYLLFSPKFEKQKNNSNSMEAQLTAYRLHTAIGTSFNNQNISLSAQFSRSKSEGTKEWFNSFKTTASYRYKAFSLNGSVQLNPNDVIDLRTYGLNNKNFINYNIYTAYSFHSFHHSLIGSISAGINYSEQYENINQHFNGNLEYKINRSWAATGYANYSNYKSTGNYSYKGNNYQFSAGIKKYFTRKTTRGNHKVRLQLFHDKNFNGIFEDNEIAIANTVVYLEDFAAITDKDGQVVFENVPQGSYKLRVNESNGLRLRRDPIIIVNKHKNLKLGMVKNNKITGKLVETKQKYDDLETDVRGVTVYAKDKEGKIFKTLVNQNNEFEFFLENGNYSIYIENTKYHFINPSREIILNNKDHEEPLIFKYEKKDRKIKVKKF